MKKLFNSKILLILLLSMFASAASAHDIEVKNADGVKIYYSWINNYTELEVSFRGDKYNSFENEYSGNVVIPESVTYNGNTYRVTSIGEGALASCGSVTSVTMPNSVNSIGWMAFMGCGMYNITISNNVTAIPQNAFTGCWNLQAIIFPNGVTSIGREAFSWSGIQSVTFPNSLTLIDYNAFEGCYSLNSVISDIKNPFQIQMNGDPFDESSVSTATLTVPTGTKKDYIAAGWNFFKEIVEAGSSNETSFTIDDISYLTNGTGTVKVTSANKSLTSISIPSSVSYNGSSYSVTAIGDYAFKGFGGITSVTLPSSITHIGEESFYNCGGLTSITIPNSVITIAHQAFSGCSGLTSVTLSTSLTAIGRSVFNGCKNLSSITIPNSITFIGENAFAGCNSLKTVESQIMTPFDINANTFSDDTYKTAELKVPQGKKSAYQSTPGWKEFKNIVEAGSSNETSFTIDDISYLTNGTGTVKVTSANKSLTSISIPSSVSYNGSSYSVTAIGDYAFKGINGISSVTLPSSITHIGEESFYNCSGLTSITIPNSVNTIAHQAFSGCSGLTSVTLSTSLTAIGRSVFNGCKKLTSITIPNNITFIGENAFAGCNSLKTVESQIMTPFDINANTFSDDTYKTAELKVPQGKKSAYQARTGWNRFSKITDGSDIQTKQTIHVATAGTLPDLISESAKEVIEDLTLTGEINGTDLKLIREMAGCPYLADTDSENFKTYFRHNIDGKLTVLDLSGVNIKTGGESYYGESYLDDDRNGTTYYIENNDELPSYAFYKSKLTSVKAPGNVKSIREYAFSECSSLSNISNLTGVTSVGDHAFAHCSSLPIVAIPGNVKTIGVGAFCDCTGITSVSIPNSVISIGPESFSGCSSLTTIKVESGNSVYDSRDNCNAIIETKSNTLIAGCKNTTIPNSVISIGYGAFREHFGLTSVTIPNSVTSIDDEAFYECSNLTTVTIPNSVTSIGSFAFWECSGLTSVISEIKNPFNISDYVFSSYTTATLTVPAGTKAKYQSTDGWKLFQNIVEEGGQGSEIGEVFKEHNIYYKIGENNTVSVIDIDDDECDLFIPNQVSYNGVTYSVTSIASIAFWDRINMTSVYIPSSLTSIGKDAFGYCCGLKSIEVESGNSVYDSRYNCNAIIETKTNTLIVGCQNTTIPYSVTSIGDGAFHSRDGMTSITIPSNVKSIGSSAFYDCNGLTSVISEIQNPFEIDKNVFYSKTKDIYATVTLTVPAGTKAKYQSTDGWKLFQNIVEAAGDNVEFTLDGTTYQGSKSEKTALVKAVDTSMNSVEIPASVSYDGTSYTVTGIADNAFAGCTMAALIWNTDFALPNNAFNNTSIGSNFLLYVKSDSYAPSSIKNVVVNGTAQTIVLSDEGGQFYCPQAFTTNKISYTHYYSMETGGNGKGWETIALPYGVETITHATRGEIVPFAAYSQNSGKKPFWLCKFGSNGFVRTNSIQAYTPYIIAMPNQTNYDNNYILAGDVTFSAENVTVAATPTFSGTFVPTFSTVPKASDVYALNVVNRYVSQTGGYDAGSKFISNLRDVRPFEAYISQASSTRGIYDINMEDGTTSMDGVLSLLDPDREIDIFTLSGQKVKRVRQSDLDVVIDQLPHGVYIVNGQIIIR